MQKIKKVLLAIIVLLVLVITKNINAFSYMSDKTETNYGQEDGLSSIIANDIVQTDDGYIWIAQYVGLTRYNGRSFDLLDKTDNGINLTGCQALATIDNELYIGTQKGLIKYSDGQFTQINILDSEFSVYDIEIVSSTVLFATSMGTYSYSRNLDKCRLVNSFSSASIESIDVATYASNIEFFYVTKDNAVYNNASASSPYYDSISEPAKCVYVDKDNIYIGTNNGHLIINKTEDILVCEKSINSMIYNNNKLYIATDEGLFIYYDGEIEAISSKLECSKSIEKIRFDYEENLWLASSETGVSKITSNELMDYFYEYQIDNWFLKKNPDITSFTVNAITKYNNLMYIATGNGLVIIDEKNGLIIDNELTETLFGIRIRDLLVFKDVLYIATYDSSIFDLVSYDGSNINLYDSSNLTENYTASSAAGQLRSFAKTDECLLIATNYGITKYDGTTFISKQLDARPLYLYTTEDTIYACMENIGVVIISSDLETQTRIDDNNHPSLKVLKVLDTLFYSDANTLYYYRNGKISVVNAMFTGSIVEILYINNQFIIATDYEIYKITSDIFADKVEYDEIGATNGLKSSLVANASGYYSQENNSYYFAASKGVYVYSLDSSQEETTPIKLGVDSILVDGKRVSGTTIKISKNTKRIVISVSVLSFKLGTKYNAMYRLRGLDDEWQPLRSGDSNEITYTNLDGGEYVFEFKVISSDGTEGYNTVSITFDKDKHFYEQPLFWIIIIVLGLSFVAVVNILIIKGRTNALIKREAEYRQITIEAMQAIARTIDAKDEYTNGHSSRVGEYAKTIATELGLSQNEVDNIYYIALLHDIGKIGIPLDILNKPGKLTSEEYEIIKTHTTKGGKILDGITTIPNIADGAKYHHERYDGKGYPEGLSGENIPYTARIIACCDIFDAMATRRSYKEPYSKKRIIEEFEKAKGTQLDPKIAEVVINLIKEGKLKINNGYNPDLKLNKDDN